MKSRKGFTLVELMVVVVIVALLAALLIPMLTARIEAARWSEGKSAAGTIATALRAYIIERAELEPGGVASVGDITLEDFMNLGDLTGKYFTAENYSVDVTSYNPSAGDTDYAVVYTVTVLPGTGPSATADMWTKEGYTLDETGTWTELTGTP
jgi:type IV pilus assembly protein PilA